jgi:Zinc finger, C2H2 type
LGIRDFTFFPQSNLLTHQEKYHIVSSTTDIITTAEAQVCNICEKKFKSLLGLQKHIKRIHTAKKTGFTCETCSKTFNERYLLVQHTYIHSGKWPFYCDICQKGAASQHRLNKHVKLHNRTQKPRKKLLKDKDVNKKKKNWRAYEYECHYCQRTEHLLKVFLCHLKSHTESNLSSTTTASKPYLYMCLVDGCNETFLVREKLKK